MYATTKEQRGAGVAEVVSANRGETSAPKERLEATVHYVLSV